MSFVTLFRYSKPVGVTSNTSSTRTRPLPGRNRLGSVSYTHLDVYKRQREPSSIKNSLPGRYRSRNTTLTEMFCGFKLWTRSMNISMALKSNQKVLPLYSQA